MILTLGFLNMPTTSAAALERRAPATAKLVVYTTAQCTNTGAIGATRDSYDLVENVCQKTPPIPAMPLVNFLSYDGSLRSGPAGETCYVRVFHSDDCTGKFSGVVDTNVVSQCQDAVQGGVSAVLNCSPAQ